MSRRPHPPGHDALALDAWPAADRAALDRASAGGSPFSRTGRAARWRPATRRSLIGAYSRWLGFLVGLGCRLEDEAPPDRITPERMERYARFLLARCAPVTVSSYLGQLHMFARDVWPEGDWRWLCEMQSQQQRMADPVRFKAARIVPQEELFRLGCELMAEAEAMPLAEDLPAGPRHPALLFRDGLMIALLAMRPLRQRNFLGLQLHRHLRQDEGSWTLAIPAAETKTHQSLTLPFPHVLVPALECYLGLYRPLLMAMRGPRDGNHPGRPAAADLWVSRCGTAMTEGALQKLLRRHTRARFGHAVNCHLFRDCVASSVADDDPASIRIAADLLGHRSLRTTYRSYITANQRAALRRIIEIIRNHRRAARRRPGHLRGDAP